MGYVRAGIWGSIWTIGSGMGYMADIWGLGYGGIVW